MKLSLLYPNNLFGAWAQYPLLILLFSALEKFALYLGSTTYRIFDPLINFYGLFGLIVCCYFSHTAITKKFASDAGGFLKVDEMAIYIFVSPIVSMVLSWWVLIRFNGNVDGGMTFVFYSIFLVIFITFEAIHFLSPRPSETKVIHIVSKYLSKPVKGIHYARMMNISLEELNVLIGKGLLKGYVYDNVLYVDANNESHFKSWQQ